MRKQITIQNMNSATCEVSLWFDSRLKQKGMGTFASLHEARGVLGEEYHELKEAFGKKDNENIKHELKDLAVACLMTLACMDAETLDW